jgi:hypothetical protein
MTNNKCVWNCTNGVLVSNENGDTALCPLHNDKPPTYTIKIEHHDRIDYCNCPSENYHVSLLTNEVRWHNDNGVVNTGMGFETLSDAQAFALGMRIALSSLNHACVISTEDEDDNEDQ